MSRKENGKFSPEAGLDLLKEVGTHNHVYFYTRYVMVSKYRGEVETHGGKGITDSRLQLLRIVDERAEELERPDQSNPAIENSVI